MSWKIGDLCVARSNQFGWTNSQIKDLNEDVVTVEFMEYEGDMKVNIYDLKLFGPFAVNKKGELMEATGDDAGDYKGWKVGDACVAQWTQDGAWYNSKILHFFNKEEILVRFVDYGNADFTTLENLQPAGSPLENLLYQSSSSPPTRSWRVGDKCAARWSEDGSWYKSEILGIAGEKVTVLFIQYGNEGVTTLDQLKPEDTLEEKDGKRNSWKVGDLCVAMWNEDNIWYNSQILDINGDTVLVRFLDYGNEDHAKLNELKPPGSLDGTVARNSFRNSNETDKEKTWTVGDLCVARWEEDKIWYNSKIVKIEDGERALVQFVGYGNKDYTTLDKLKPAGSLARDSKGSSKEIDKEAWAVGDLCVARWEEDQIWYNSKIVEICGENALVQFVDYGNEDFTQLSQLKAAGTLELEDVKEKGAIPKIKKSVLRDKQTIPKEKGAIHEEKRATPKPKNVAISSLLRDVSDQESGDFKPSKVIKLSSSEKIAPTEDSINAAQENLPKASTPVEQLQNIFPNFSPAILLDTVRKFGTIEEAASELLNYGPDEDFSKEIVMAEKLHDMFPNISPEILFDTARKYGTIENAVCELLNYVPDEDFSNERGDENNCVKERVAKSSLLLKEDDMFKKVTLTEKRDFNPDDPLENKFRLAKGHYLSVSGQFASPIESIDYVENRTLMEIFERKKSQFKSEGKNAKEYFLFHGTDDVNIDSILWQNFQMSYAGKHGQAHGRGVYFSEKTAIPNRYMRGTKKTLLLCRVLLGKEFDGQASDIPEGFDSKSVQPDEENRANINVIKDVDQILPCFVLNLAPDGDDDLTSASDMRMRLTHFGQQLFRHQTRASALAPQLGASPSSGIQTLLHHQRQHQSRVSALTPTNAPQYSTRSLNRANALAPTNAPQYGSSFTAPIANASQLGASSANQIQTLLHRFSQRRSRASSLTPTNAPQYSARSLNRASALSPRNNLKYGASFTDPQLGASSASHSQGLLPGSHLETCPYDASHKLSKDLMKVHVLVCRNRPVAINGGQVYSNRKGRVIKIINENYGVLACSVGEDKNRRVFQVIFDVHDVWIGDKTLKDIGKTLKDVMTVGEYVKFNGVHFKDMKQEKKRWIQDLATSLVISQNASFDSARFPSNMVTIKEINQIQEEKLANFKVVAKAVGAMELHPAEKGLLESLKKGNL